MGLIFGMFLETTLYIISVSERGKQTNKRERGKQPSKRE